VSEHESRIGQVLGGRFEITSLVGRGGMASVYRAEDAVLGRSVAIKLFELDATDDAARLASEVRLLSALNHSNLVTVHDAHLSRGGGSEPSYLVMELVDGVSLKEQLLLGPLSGALTAEVASGVGEALHVVHKDR